MKIIKEFGIEIAAPLTDIINRAFLFGEYPQGWKIEMVTPVPKVHPPSSTKDLRKISGLKNLSKIAEKILSEFIVKDMKVDPSQYGNKKGVSINHYLIRMINKILTALDKNSSSESMAVLVELIDWSQAFDRQ